MGTRVIEPHPLIFDHGAQFFTVNDSRFGELVNAWMEKGLVREWQGTIGELQNGGHFVPFLSSPPRYIATNGMRFLADSLLSEVIKLKYLCSCNQCLQQFKKYSLAFNKSWW